MRTHAFLDVLPLSRLLGRFRSRRLAKVATKLCLPLLIILLSFAPGGSTPDAQASHSPDPNAVAPSTTVVGIPGVQPEQFALGISALSTGGERGWVTNPANGHHYRLTDPLSWPDAEQQAVQWGGHLVTLNVAREESWLRDRFGKLEYFWIGFNDIETEGSFEWVSGRPITYTNWCSGEPNNFNDEDAAIINWAHGPGFGDCWNDLPVTGMLRGIVEIGRGRP